MRPMRFALLCVAFVGLVAVSAANNYYVDGVNGSDAQGDGSLLAPFQTITFAINFCVSNMEENPPPHDIYVIGTGAATVYTENIVMQPLVSLYGGTTPSGTTQPKSRTSVTVIQAVNNNAPAVVGAPKTRIDKFTIRGGSHGVLAQPLGELGINDFAISRNDIDLANWDGSGRSDDAALSYNGVRCLNCTQTGLQRVQITTNTITGNGNNGDGIYLQTSSPLIEDNTIEGHGGNGISCVLSAFGGLQSPKTDRSEPKIQNNEILDNSENGVYAEDIIADSTDYGVTMFIADPAIINNVISGNGRDGVRSTHLLDPSISDQSYNEVFKDRTERIELNAIRYNGQCGITLCWSSSPTILSNEISYNGFAGIAASHFTDPIIDSNFIYEDGNYGIWVRCHSTATITNNQIQWIDGPGIQIDNFAAPKSISLNAIAFSNADGIWIRDFAAPTIEQNVVVCNNGHGISIEGEAQGTIFQAIVMSNFLDGIRIVDFAAPEIRESFVTGNKLNGIFCGNDTQPTIQNVVIEDNHAMGVFLDDDSHPLISDCIIANNDLSGIYEHVVSCDPAGLTNNCFYANQDGNYIDEGSDVLTSSTEINAANNGLSPVGANIVGNPLFRAWGNFSMGNPIYVDLAHAGELQNGTDLFPFDLIVEGFLMYSFQLSAGSPCIGAGTGGTNIGAFPGQSSFLPQGNLAARILVKKADYYDNNLVVNHLAYLQGEQDTGILCNKEFTAMFPKSGSVVDGFTFKKYTGESIGANIALHCFEGSTAIVQHCKIEFANRAGILCYKSSPVIMNNTIENNYTCGIQCISGSPSIVNNPSISNNVDSGIDIEQSSTAIVSGNTLTANGFAGIKSRSNSTPHIMNNLITQSQHGIYVENSNTNMIIQRNTLSDHTQCGIICYYYASPDIRSNTIQDNLTYGVQCYYNSSPNIYNNVITNNSWDGIFCFDQSSPKIVNNMIYRNRNSGIRVEQLSNAQVINNTIVSNSYSGVYLIKGSQPFIVNNILAHNFAYGIREEDAGSDPQIASNNSFYGNLRSYFDEGFYIYDTPDQVNTSVDNGSYPHANNFDNDPLFVNFYTDDFHIQAGSPCIDTADAAWAPSFDFDGDSRPQGAGYDVGADEYKSTAGSAFDLSGSLWDFVTITNAFTAPAGAASAGAIQIVSSSNTNTFGYWSASHQPIPIFSDNLYCASFTVACDVTDSLRVPSLRLRSNTDDMAQSNFLQVNSTGDGSCVPTPSGRTYDLYIFPPQGADGSNNLVLSFDLLNFSPDDAPQATLTLTQLVVNRIPASTLGVADVIKSYDFTSDTEGWSHSGAIYPFASPAASFYPGQLELLSSSNTNTFGYWSSPRADFTVTGPDRLYRGTFAVSSSLDNQADVPSFRLRLNSLDSQIAVVQTVESAGSGSNSPGRAPKTYQLFYAAPSAAPPQAMTTSFDLLNFDPTDRADAQLNLESAVIESFDLPTFP